MSLPKIDLPRYKHHLFGLNTTIHYRGFTTREQKILLAAKEDGSKEAMVEAIKQIIDLCTFGELDIDSIPFFDIEDLFIRIRAKSVSDISELTYRVKDENDEYTDEKINVKIHLNDIKVTCPEGHDKKIMLSDDLGIMMQYPTLLMLEKETSEFEKIKECIECIFNSEEVWYIKDTDPKEVEEFIDSLDIPSLEKIKNFFDTMPRLRHEVNVKLKSGETKTIKYEGLQDFF